MREICTKKLTLSQLGAKKTAYPPQSDGQTDISNFRVASLPKIRTLSQLGAEKIAFQPKRC